MRKVNIFKSELIEKPSVQRRVRKWIKALRSGKYRQAQDKLRAKPYLNFETGLYVGKWGYCCLGVACDLLDHEAWEGSGHVFGSGDKLAPKIEDSIEERTQILNREGLAKFGLKPLGNARLATMNDNGESFREIANYLETNLKAARS